MTKKFNDSLAHVAQGMAGFGGYKDGPLVGINGMWGADLSWLDRAAVYRIPEDAFKRGYSWIAEDKQITEIEAVERKLKLKQKKKQALAMSRLDGEAYIYFDVRRGTAGQEINLDAVRLGDLRFANVIRRNQITIGELDYDPMSPYFMQPKYYEMTGNTSGAVRIHPSRIARFVNHPRPEDGFGRSILWTVASVIQDALTARANTSALTTEARVWVIKMKDLVQRVCDEDGAADVAARYNLFKQMMQTNSLAVLDLDNEEFSQQTTQFTGLPEVIESMRREVSAALEIPYALLFGRSGGLGTNGETDLKEYYDNVSVVQHNDIDGPCEILDECLLRSALGNRPEEIYKQWNSLYEISDREKAEIAKIYADAAATAVNAAILMPDMITTSLINQWVEIGAFPGIEQDTADAQARIQAEAEETSQAEDVVRVGANQEEQVTDSILELAREILNE